MKKTVLVVLAAATLALVLAACSSGGGASSSASASSIAVDQVSASMAKITLTATSESAEAKVTVNAGESYVMASNFDEGEAEVNLKGGDDVDTTDYAYEGSGVGTMGVDPGEYTVTVTPTNATGVVYILSYDADQLDFDKEASDLFDQVAALFK